MNLRIKLTGLGLLAVLASAVVAVNAFGTSGGHFGSDKGETKFEIIEQEGHTIEFYAFGSAIYCQTAIYKGVEVGMKFTSVTLTPEYENCETTSNNEEVDIETNDCTFEFTVHSEPETKHSTVHLQCPEGKKFRIIHQLCELEIAPQTLSGVVYTATQWEGTKALTIDMTIKEIPYTAHGGCQLVGGTNRNDGEIKGAAIVKAWDAAEPTKGANIEVT